MQAASTVPGTCPFEGLKNSRTRLMWEIEITLADKRSGAAICILSFAQIWDEKIANI